jgi:hypothetical protein
MKHFLHHLIFDSFFIYFLGKTPKLQNVEIKEQRQLQLREYLKGVFELLKLKSFSL